LSTTPPRGPLVATEAAEERKPARRRQRAWVAVAATLALGVAALAVALRSGSSSDALVTEAVNDHLRVLYAQQPIEIESGGIHQVKPWFAGRLDFAPRLGFEGDADYSLAGGSVGYFIDRKAAVFIFKHRQHVITLFEFRADGLPWGAAGELKLGKLEARHSQLRGFQVISFRDGDLGYALVSDVDASALEQLAARVASGL
jgi:anti-sigma factor RsiW